MFTINRRVRILGKWLVVGLVLSLIAYGSIVAWVSLDAECSLGCMLHTFYAIDEYVEEKGDWPRSWSDLDGYPHEWNSPYELPRDQWKVAQCVRIDFDANICDVAAVTESAIELETERDFPFVVPRGVCFLAYRHRIKDVVDSAKKACRKRQAEKPALVKTPD